MTTANRLDIQEAEAVMDRINRAKKDHESEEYTAIGRINIVAAIGEMVLAHADKIVASIDFATYGIDEDPKSEANLIKLAAWLGLMDKDNRDVFWTQFELDKNYAESLLEKLRDETDVDLRNRATSYLFGWIEEEN